MQFFFDLDGPLLDVRGKYYAIYADWLGRHRYPRLSPAEYWELKRDRVPEAEIARRSVPGHVVDDYLKHRLAVIEDTRYLRYDKVWPGVSDFLSALRLDHWLAVVTMRNRRETLLAQLDWLQLAPLFSRIFSVDENRGDWTVKRDLIREAVWSPGDTFMVGDTEADIQAGRELGLRTCAVTCGIRNEALVSAMNADLVCGSVLCLRQVVKS